MMDLTVNHDSQKPAQKAGNVSYTLPLQFNIPGNPVALGRHRTTRTGINYTPQKSVDAKTHVKWCVSQSYQGIPFQEPLHVKFCFYFQPPQSIAKKHPYAIMDESIPVQTKPDMDNLIKLVCDSLNGILWTDDKVITSISATKKYSLTPRTEIYVNRASQETE